MSSETLDRPTGPAGSWVTGLLQALFYILLNIDN
jgi:hypothetical protein